MQRYDDYSKVNSFADAEKKYAETKVLKSKNHPAEQDVRPLGTRSRKWERIKKLSDDCYVMLDGCVHTDDIWNGRYERPHELVTLNTTFAPIIWTRKGETESIRIRNGLGSWAHNSRYTFFENWLPMGLEFQIDSGRQYIIESHNRSERYYLPKTMHGSVWHGHGITPKVDDGHYLTFTRYTPYHPIGDSSWKPQGDTFEYAHPKQVVDKEAKKKLKPYIDSMWEYITTMYNVLDIKRALVIGGYDWHASRERREHNRDYYSRVKSEDKDDKLAFAVNFLTDERCTDFTVTTEEDRKRLRSIYNRWINSELHLITTLPSQIVRRSNK